MIHNPTILDGKALADKICLDLKDRTLKLISSGIHPQLTIITASNDPASAVYVRNKIKRCEEIGIAVDHMVVPSLTTDVMERVQDKNCPVIVQMPFESDELTVKDLGRYVTAENDVDGFVNIENVAALAMGETPLNYPCTPLGVMRLLQEYRIPLDGSCVAMIGRSNIVGRPLARMLEHEGATVSLIHSKTPQFTRFRYLRAANIIISATGKVNTVDKLLIQSCCYGEPNSDVMCKKVFVDVGMNRDENGKLCGDIPQDVKDMAIAYTPVPGGVGPMTVAMLMSNTVEVYERRKQFMDERNAIIGETKNHG